MPRKDDTTNDPTAATVVDNTATAPTHTPSQFKGQNADGLPARNKLARSVAYTF